MQADSVVATSTPAMASLISFFMTSSLDLAKLDDEAQLACKRPTEVMRIRIKCKELFLPGERNGVPLFTRLIPSSAYFTGLFLLVLAGRNSFIPRCRLEVSPDWKHDAAGKAGSNGKSDRDEQQASTFLHESVRMVERSGILAFMPVD